MMHKLTLTVLLVAAAMAVAAPPTDAAKNQERLKALAQELRQSAQSLLAAGLENQSTSVGAVGEGLAQQAAVGASVTAMQFNAMTDVQKDLDKLAKMYAAAGQTGKANALTKRRPWWPRP